MSFQFSGNDQLPKTVCSSCWSSLENFHEFYLGANRAKERFLANRMESEKSFCGDITDNIGNGTETVSFKAEPPEIIEDFDYSQPIDHEFDEIHLEPAAATIDKRDFDAIFLDELTYDGEVKIEKEIMPERYMGPIETENALESNPIPSRKPKRICNRAERHEPRKRPAESPSTYAEYSGNSFEAKKKITRDRKHTHSDDVAELKRKRVKR